MARRKTRQTRQDQRHGHAKLQIGSAERRNAGWQTPCTQKCLEGGNATYRTVVTGDELPARGVRNAVLVVRRSGPGQTQLRCSQHPIHSNADQLRIPVGDAKPAPPRTTWWYVIVQKLFRSRVRGPRALLHVMGRPCVDLRLGRAATREQFGSAVVQVLAPGPRDARCRMG